jgi:ribonuclease-3
MGDGEGGSMALAESEGSTKKQAQQEAARIAFARLLSEQRAVDAKGAVEVTK